LKTILLTGRNGQVGHELVSALAPLGRVVATGRDRLDLARPDSIVACVREVKPDIIVNAAGYTAVDDAELNPDAAWQANAVGPGILAEQAKAVGALLVHYSTDYVYDGTKGAPYVEDDPPNPVNVYGKSKLGGENAILATGCSHLILRASWIYSNRGRNFLRAILDRARHPGPVPVVSDQIGSPCWAGILTKTTADVITKLGEKTEFLHDTYHFSSPDAVSRFEFARAIVARGRSAAGHDIYPGQIQPILTENYRLPAKRPLHVVTSKNLLLQKLGVMLPAWQAQLDQYFRNCVNGSSAHS
jgi:dTDP-4-dehydrorhamnose reductase